MTLRVKLGIAIHIDIHTAGATIDIHVNARGPTRIDCCAVINAGRWVDSGGVRFTTGFVTLGVFQLALFLDNFLVALTSGIFNTSFLAGDSFVGVTLGLAEIFLLLLNTSHCLVMRVLDVALGFVDALGAGTKKAGRPCDAR